ncbi:response regulator transcription factor [Agrobacterium rhizogenes]|uniref:Two-component response regulator protein n=1 Tax=Rhizobium rhizogenes (strain K84 / ATCC BAA-868) TaxID=311403 RepID=B9JM23_RHIR8|nr:MULTISPECIES: response regulator transcription factor [Rhizobium]ACM28737.1 two-component response regulator protein [Rhizobium rhizogenes K84]OCJ18999.1 DNA-binding response regulator [Agrobacterium sp. B131/95]EJK88033.1 response regulator [Rhizobium sp. AP16]NTI43728.1 response regulator transcription factor [Rhizobium rhizogenes]NTI63703.1 response regulator transcription factor [Rhizobium rhizogenes]
MTETLPSMVFVIDDDASLRDALSSLFRSVGIQVELYGSPSEFLAREPVTVGESCLVLDIRLPGVSGLDFQNQLSKLGNTIPIIFMTGHGDVPMSVRAMKAGALDFLIKPFRDQDMLDAVSNALALDRERRATKETMSVWKARYETLTAREREVIAMVTSGLMNKQIAGMLGVSEITVKLHRGHLMEKMGVRTLAELVKIYELLRPGLKDNASA